MFQAFIDKLTWFIIMAFLAVAVVVKVCVWWTVIQLREEA